MKRKIQIPIKNEHDFKAIMLQEKDRYYLSVDGELFLIDKTCLFNEFDSLKWFFSVYINFEKDLKESSTVDEYDATIDKMNHSYKMPFRIH